MVLSMGELTGGFVATPGFSWLVEFSFLLGEIE